MLPGGLREPPRGPLHPKKLRFFGPLEDFAKESEQRQKNLLLIARPRNVLNDKSSKRNANENETRKPEKKKQIKTQTKRNFKFHIKM